MGGEDTGKGAGLVLRLGYDGWTAEKITCIKKEPAHPFSTPGAAAAPAIGPLLTLSLPDQAASCWKAQVGASARQSSPRSPVSSLSGAHPASSTGGGKRDRDVVSEEAEAAERTPFGGRASDEEEEGNTRKKLRLTKEQSAFLENMFKEHSTLNPKLKQTLANKLNLRPRQVEVWFQNRRARTKLKQTEMDCELLRKCCESLTDENRRLQRELQELKALKLASPHYLKLPPPTLTMCPACERIGPFTGNTANGAAAANAAFPSGTAKTHFYSPIAARPPPAAC